MNQTEKYTAGSIFNKNSEPLENEVVNLLRQKKLTVACAESCTGGLLAKRITNVSGASEIFGCGIVSYSNAIKEKLLFVEKSMLEKYGAVSFAVAAEMAVGARKQGESDIGIGITGIAGPLSDCTKKPVGLVYVAICDKAGVKVTKLNINYSGENAREYNRYYSSSQALDLIEEYAAAYPQKPDGMTDLDAYLGQFRK